MKIVLLKQFYSFSDMSEISGININTLYMKARILEIEPDLKISGSSMFSTESKNKILDYYQFEKTFSEIYYRQRNNKKEHFEIFESSLNSE